MNMEKLREWMAFASACERGEFGYVHGMGIPGNLFTSPDDAQEPEPFSSSFDTQEPVPFRCYTSELEVLILIDMPGVERESLEVLVRGERLTLRGYQRGPGLGWLPFDPNEGQVTAADGAASGLPVTDMEPFERQIRLPIPADTERLRARLLDGRLRITYPRRMQPEYKIPLAEQL